MGTQKKVAFIQKYIQDHLDLTNVELANQLNVHIETVKYHIRKLGLQGKRNRRRITCTDYDDYITTHFPNQSATLIAKALGITKNRVLKIATRLGVRHAPKFIRSNYSYKNGCYPIRENLVGERFGRLLVQRQLGTNQYGQMKYECLCDCGNTAVSIAGNLKNGHTKSCGCLRRDFYSRGTTKNNKE